MASANVRRRGTGSPSRCGGEIPFAYAIGLPEERAHASQRTDEVAPWPLVPQNETSIPRFLAAAALSSAARSAAADRAALLKAAAARNLGIEVSFCGTKGHGATSSVRWDA